MNTINNDGKPVTLGQAAWLFAELAKNYGKDCAFTVNEDVSDVLEIEANNITEKNGEAVIKIEFSDELEPEWAY